MQNRAKFRDPHNNIVLIRVNITLPTGCSIEQSPSESNESFLSLKKLFKKIRFFLFVCPE